MAFLLLGSLLLFSSGFSQSVVDEELTTLFEVHDTVSGNYTLPLKDADNDISVVVSLGFLFYKSFISSQDNPSCVFTPSCSVYAVEAIGQYGFLLGWLKTFDRLSRCHGLVNHRHYPFDTEKQRYYDPVH